MKNKFPFCRTDNSLCSYVYRDDSPAIEWRDNYVFEDELVYERYRGGRSSMTMCLRSKTDGRVYPMFWVFFDECIRRPDNGPGPTFKGRWTFCKRGTNYSIKPA